MPLSIRSFCGSGANFLCFFATDDDDCWWVVKVTTNQSAASHEYDIYQHLRCQSLEGSIVPVCVGLYDTGPGPSDARCWVMVLEDIGSPLYARFENWFGLDRLNRFGELLPTPRAKRVLTASRESLKLAYLTLHRHGVVHGDVSLLNICRRLGDNQVRLVDFDRAPLISRSPEEEGGRAMADGIAMLQDLRVI